jgi:hypothetical protein
VTATDPVLRPEICAGSTRGAPVPNTPPLVRGPAFRRQKAAFNASTTVPVMSSTIQLSVTPKGPGGYVKDMEACRDPSALEIEMVP